MKKEKKYIAHMMEGRKCLISYVVIILVDAVLLLFFEFIIFAYISLWFGKIQSEWFIAKKNSV